MGYFAMGGGGDMMAFTEENSQMDCECISFHVYALCLSALRVLMSDREKRERRT